VSDGSATPGSCPFAEVLSAYLDGELSAQGQREVAAHLAVHAACRDELHGVAQVRDAVRALPWLDGPAEFWSGLAVAAAVGADPPVRSPVRTASRNRWGWGAAAAACLMAAAGLAGTRVDQASTSSTTPTRPLATVKVSAEPVVVTSVSTGPPVGQQLVVHNGGVDDAMDGVASFLRVP
jgi:anti-sigma factor RsiW